MTLIGGQLLAVLVIVALQQLLDDAQLHAWGWRIPFVIGAATAVIAALLRRGLHETSSAETRGKPTAKTPAVFNSCAVGSFFGKNDGAN